MTLIKKHNIIYIVGINGIIHIFNKNGKDITPIEYTDEDCQNIKKWLDNLVKDMKIAFYNDWEDEPKSGTFLHYRLVK